MSNRLKQFGRVPLIPDPLIAVKASQAFALHRERAERVLDLGAACTGIFTAIRNALSGFSNAHQRAAQIQHLSSMSDQSLAKLGVQRDQLSNFFKGDGSVSIDGQQATRDSER